MATSKITNLSILDDAVRTAGIQDAAVTAAKTSGVPTLFRPIAQPFFINSNMQIYQRGYNFAGVTGGNTKYSADRWRFNVGNIGTYEMNNTQVTTGGAYNDGFRQCARIDCTTADGSPASSDYLYFEYVAEAQDCLAWKKGTTSATTMTLSFWVKSNKTGTAQVNLKDDDNDRMVSATYSISSANTWEQIIVTFPMETSNKLNNDNGKGFVFEWWLGAGTTYSSGTAPTSWEARTDADRGANNLAINDNTANDWSITGIQAEVGSYTSSTIPPYQWETYGNNLDRCQRYYISYGNVGTTQTGFPARAYSGTGLMWAVTLPKPLRASPTVTLTGTIRAFGSSNTHDSTSALGVSSYANTNSNMVMLQSTGFSGLANDRIYNVMAINDTFYTLDAEL